MVSQRQKEAKKRYREQHPELFPEPPPSDPNKKKKKNNNTKPKTNDFKRKNLDPSKKRHVLRIPGMKPGESCYICKEIDHIAKNCPKKSEWERNKTCLLCRHRGHSLKNCPNKKDGDEFVEEKLCYNCGEMGHSLSRCPQPLQDGGTKFAKCFICNLSGHLSKDCPKNTHGIYPKGGCCKLCGGVTHLARDCRNKINGISFPAGGLGDQSSEFERPNKITKFTSGDDLEDDFVEPLVPAAVDEKDKSTKSKNKGPKVVNFTA